METSSQRSRDRWVYGAAAAWAILVFVTDQSIPLGVAMGVPYVVLVLLALRLPSTRDVMGAAVLASVLTIAGLVLSPGGGEAWKVYSNRSLALFAIWAAAIVCIQVKRSERQVRRKERQLEEAHGELEQRVEARTAELATAREELQRSHDELEERVEERTSELADAREDIQRSHDQMELRVEERTFELATAREDLQRSHDDLEERVEARTSELAEAREELQQSHDDLESRIQERTEELAVARQNLEVSHAELEQRVEERTGELEAAMEEISQRNTAISEMSMPVVDVWQGIILLPLVGILDTERAQNMVERLLESIVQNRTRVAILDITGVPTVDTSVARHLVQTVESAQMLGAEVVLTGFSPDIAQTLTHLNVGFGSLRTRGSLRDGIAEAFGLIGHRVAPIGEGRPTDGRSQDAGAGNGYEYVAAMPDNGWRR